MNLHIPGYEVLERVGHGGMAEVYRARHLRLERDVALKVMLEQFSRDSTFCDRFVREARIAAKLNHPHIVQIFDVDQHEKQLFLSMEYVDGGDLLEKRRQPLSHEQILNILEQLTQALDYAHGQGYIHRDIKPANILFRGEGSLVVSDFGIARAIHSETNMTAAGSMVGTPNYMSPEQAKGLDLDGRADLYSVAVIAYQMLTGELPYVGDSTISIAIKHITEPVPTLEGDLAPLQNFFNRALAKNAEDRFATGAHLVEALREELENVPRSLTPTVIADKTRLAPRPPSSSVHEKATTVNQSHKWEPTRETLARPTTQPGGTAETLAKTEVLHGDYISRAPASIRHMLRRINDITGVVIHPRRRGLTVILSVLLLAALGFWYSKQFGGHPGTEAFAGIKSDTENTLTPEQQMRVNQLLENARQDMATGRLSTPLGNNAYEKYLAVLAMAPGHRAAVDGLNTIAQALLDAAQEAANNGDRALFQQYITQAKTVSPEHPDIAKVEQNQKETRQKREQQLSQLFMAANQAKSAGDIEQTVAHLNRILALDSDNITARNELSAIAETRIAAAKKAIDEGNHIDAEEQLVSAKNIGDVLKNSELNASIAALQSTINSKQNQQQKQNRLDRYLQKADAAFGRGDYMEGGDSAIENYRNALDIDNNNRRARQGVEQVKQALADRANRALDALQIDKAQNDMRNLRAIDARADQLSQLESALARAERQVAVNRKQVQRISELYDRAERYLTAQRADGADKIYRRIEQLSPGHPDLPALGKKIADGYVFLAQNEIDGKDWDDVNVWVERGLKHVPDHKKLIEMRAYAEEQKKNRKKGFF